MPTDPARTRAEKTYAKHFPWRIGFLGVAEEWVSGYMAGESKGAAAQRTVGIELVEARLSKAYVRLHGDAPGEVATLLDIRDALRAQQETDW